MTPLQNHRKKNLPIIAAIVAVGVVLAMAILFWNKGSAEGSDGGDAHGHAESGEKEGAKEAGGAGDERAEDEHKDEGVVKLPVMQAEKAGITTAVAGAATIENIVKLPGEVRVNDDLTAHVVPRLGGVAESVPAQLGQTVKKGQVLAVISSPELADLRSAASAAQVRLGLAKTIYEREKKLWEDRISAQQDFQQAEQALREAELTLQAARSKLAALEVGAGGGGLNRYELRAPFDAVVVEKHITRGEAVQENTNVFVLTDLSRVWVDVAVTPKDLASVRSGATAVVSATGSDMKAVGKVSYVGALVGAQSRAATARVVIDNPGGAWRPGLFVDVALVQGTKQAAVAIPADAIQTVEDKPVVFVVTEGGFRTQPIVAGINDGKGVEILEGLAAGTRYVNRGSFVLKAELGKGSAEHDH